MAAPAKQKQTYLLDEVAEMLGIGRQTAYSEARRGTFPTLRLTRRIVVPKAEFDAWYKASIVHPKHTATK